jgi:soluble lytic murein transglycosylase-like protein
MSLLILETRRSRSAVARSRLSGATVLVVLLATGCSTPFAVRTSHATRAPIAAASAPDASPTIPAGGGVSPIVAIGGSQAERDLGPPLHRWSALTRLGRDAMRAHRYVEAEQHLSAALASTAALAADDLRARTSVGDLVRLAALSHKVGRQRDANRLMSKVRDHLRMQGIVRERAAAYESLFLALTQTPRSHSIGRGFRSSSGGRRHRAPAIDTFDRLIATAARRYDVDPALVKAVVAAESNFDADAISTVGAQGLMQLMPETARRMGVEAPFEPGENLRGGVRYLSQMLDRYGDLRRALAAYNAGPAAVDRHQGLPPYPETRAYVSRVLHYYRDYRGDRRPFAN